MKGKAITYQNYTVYPEYCELNLCQLLHKSTQDKNYHIATLSESNTARVIKEGKILYYREKYRDYPPSPSKPPNGIKPEVIQLEKKKVLILICYELLFPEDYLPTLSKPDIILHMVGWPMEDENQREGWIAVQKTFSIVYNCPLVCCCGGEEGRMNITRIIKPEGVYEQ